MRVPVTRATGGGPVTVHKVKDLAKDDPIIEHLQKGMETMRRFLATLSAFGLLGVMVGCHHTAGYCDCDSSNPGCRTCGATAAVPVKPEQLQEMPKENGKKEENKENKDENKDKENKDKENKENKDGGPGF